MHMVNPRKCRSNRPPRVQVYFHHIHRQAAVWLTSLYETVQISYFYYWKYFFPPFKTRGGHMYWVFPFISLDGSTNGQREQLYIYGKRWIDRPQWPNRPPRAQVYFHHIHRQAAVQLTYLYETVQIGYFYYWKYFFPLYKTRGGQPYGVFPFIKGSLDRCTNWHREWYHI